MKTLLERKISLVVIILQFLVSLLVCIYFGTTGLALQKYHKFPEVRMKIDFH